MSYSGGGGGGTNSNSSSDNNANLKVNNITSRDEKRGAEVTGIVEAKGTYFVPPSGTTAERGSRGRGVIGGGLNPAYFNVIQYITISTLGNSTDFGDLYQIVGSHGACASSTRGFFTGGSEPANSNVIQYITFATTGDALEFGDVAGTANGIRANASTSSSTRGVYAGGANTPGNIAVNTIEYLTLATFGNTQNFGDLSVAKRTEGGGTSNGIRGVFAGGYTVPGNTAVNTMDYVNIASTGDAIDFGDLSNQSRYVGACSDSHGGLS